MFKTIAKIGAVISGFFMTASVHAASLLPTGTLTTVADSATDTALEVALWAVGVVALMKPTWFIVSAVSKAFSKAGVK